MPSAFIAATASPRALCSWARRIVGLGIEQLDGGEREGRERLVEREVGLQLDREAQQALPARVLVHLDDAAAAQRAEDLDRCAGVRVLRRARFVAVEHERAHGGERLALVLLAPADHPEHHGVSDAHATDQGLRLRSDELLESLLAPGDEALRRRLLLRGLGLLAALRARGLRRGLGGGLRVLDLVLGGHRDHVALGVEARATGTTGDLVELAGREPAHLLPVELGERGDDDGADGHVDADPEGVRAADHSQQAALRELLDETPIAREHAGVVHPDPGAHEP
jgi:hypothetical protein